LSSSYFIRENQLTNRNNTAQATKNLKIIVLVAYNNKKHNKHYLEDNALSAAVVLKTANIEENYGALPFHKFNLSNRSFDWGKEISKNADILLFLLNILSDRKHS